MNIVEPILFQCKINPLVTAICTPGAQPPSVNYATLEKFIHNSARSALKAGLAPGQVVAVSIGDPLLHVAVALGLMRLNIATVSMSRPQLPKELVPDAILADRPDLPGHLPGRIIRFGFDWVTGDGIAPDYDRISPTNEDQVCYIALTSGTTGDAKGVALRHKVFLSRVAHVTHSKGSRFAHCSRFFCDLGVATPAGFQYTLSLLSRGSTIYFLGPEPTDILQALELHKIQGMATSPYGLGEFLKFFEGESVLDTSFDHIICQGALLSKELSQRARARMCQNLYSSYGSTENGTVAFGPASVTEAVPGAVGYVTAGVNVEIVDPDGRVLPPETDGRIRIRSRYMAEGYIGDPELTRAHFRHGCFYAGDIGRLRVDGIMVVSGREKTALNIGGDSISPERVEEVLVSFGSIDDAAVFARTNELGIDELTALIVGGSALNEQALNDYCAVRLPPSCIPKRLISVAAIPRSSQGKIERQQLADLAKTATPSAGAAL